MSLASPEADGLAETLRILGHPLRLAILRVVAEGERAVGDIAAATGIAMSTLSQQLAVLRQADLVQTRREARQVFYSLNPEALAETGGGIGRTGASRRRAGPLRCAGCRRQNGRGDVRAGQATGLTA
jgi:DNA-binding transcriptional ArsR family regulator